MSTVDTDAARTQNTNTENIEYAGSPSRGTNDSGPEDVGAENEDGVIQLPDVSPRVRELHSRMTLEEKLVQILGYWVD